MSSPYKKLLSPIRIGTSNVILKNRLCYPNSSPHMLQGPEPYPADSYIAYVAGVAKSGASIVTVADWSNYPAQRSPGVHPDFAHMQAFDMSDLSVHNYFSAMAQDVHMYNARLLLNKRISFPKGFALNERHAPDLHTGAMLHLEALPAERMGEVIDAYVKEMELYRSLGFDGLSIRSDDFMRPADDERRDDYGGTVENRTRLLLDTLRAVRKALGPDFIIEVVHHGEQPLGYHGGENGFTLADTLEFVKLADDTVDILQIREKDAGLAHPLSYNSTRHVYPTLDYCRAIRETGVKALLSPNGGYRDPDDIERALESGVIDMVHMARAFLCEPNYVGKLRDGRAAELTPCIRCNLCHGNFRPPWVSVCSVNPELGIQHKRDRFILPVTRQKRVAVLGGGPAGMKAAIVAADRGHDVTLYEKSGYLGGLLSHAEYFSFKWTLKDLRDWLVRELDRAGVHVRLEHAPTPEELTAAAYDTVIAALGTTPCLPGSIAGLRDEGGRPLYPTCYDVFGKEASLGKRVVIVGGSETGVETGMYLAEHGHDVTILTRQKEIAYDASHLHYIFWCQLVKDEATGKSRLAAAWEKYPNLQGIPEVVTTAVRDNTVFYRSPDGQEHTLPADSVVICGGVTPRTDEAMAYAGCAEEFYVTGDVNGMGNIQKCMRDAWSTANMI